jgi:hypothetical protein
MTHLDVVLVEEMIPAALPVVIVDLDVATASPTSTGATFERATGLP